MNLYDKFKAWTAARKRTDIWRAVVAIVIAYLILTLMTGCATDDGPRMMLGTSYEGDGFIRLTQPIYERGSVECFVEYEHHSEILRETNEDTGDFGIIGCSKQFPQWSFLQ